MSILHFESQSEGDGFDVEVQRVSYLEDGGLTSVSEVVKPRVYYYPWREAETSAQISNFGVTEHIFLSTSLPSYTIMLYVFF